MHKVQWRSITVQGSASKNRYLTSFLIQYSDDNSNFYAADDGKIFAGNKNHTEKVTHVFKKPFYAKVIRLMPLTWKGEIELRWDAFYSDKLIGDLKNRVKAQEIEIYSLNGKLTKSNSLLRKSKQSQEDLQEYINRLKA
jgi:hypothetical protein